MLGNAQHFFCQIYVLLGLRKIEPVLDWLLKLMEFKMKTFTLVAILLGSISSVSAAVLSLQGEGVYRIGEFDSLHSAKEIAGQYALEDMARKATERVLSLQKIDKMGYYSRASWLVNSSLLTKEVVSDEVAVCSEGVGLCVTVKLKGVLDTAQSEKHLKLLYSDVKLAKKLEALIEDESERERLVLEGETLDYAAAKERQHKRKQIIDYLSGREIKKNVGPIDSSLIQTIYDAAADNQRADLSRGSTYLEYQEYLNEIQRDLAVTIVEQNAITHADGSGGVRLRVSLESPTLETTLSWVAEKLGIQDGNWKLHREINPKNLGEVWVYGVEVDGTLGEVVSESVIIGEQTDLVIEADRYLIQYGINSVGIRQHSNGKPDYRLNREKLKLVNELGKAQVCIEFSLGNLKPVEKCIAGGAPNSKGDHINPAWDINSPFLWYAKDGASFNVFIPIDNVTLRDPTAMRNLSFQYQVTVKAETLGK